MLDFSSKKLETPYFCGLFQFCSVLLQNNVPALRNNVQFVGNNEKKPDENGKRNHWKLELWRYGWDKSVSHERRGVSEGRWGRFGASKTHGLSYWNGVELMNQIARHSWMMYCETVVVLRHHWHKWFWKYHWDEESRHYLKTSPSIRCRIISVMFRLNRRVMVSFTVCLGKTESMKKKRCPAVLYGRFQWF